MLLETGLFDYLSNHAGVSGQVSDRIYPMVLPQPPTFPAITYQRISAMRTHSHSGGSGLARPRIQFDVWSDAYKEAKDTAEELRLALQGFRGTMGSVRVDGVLYDQDQDFYEDETDLYRISIDVLIWSGEATS